MASNVSPDVERAAMESQPLLGAPVAGFPAIPVAPTKVAPRQWRHKWYHIFGDCGAQDVAATCLAWKVPCVAWAWNQNRASQRSFWLELCRFLVMTIGLFVMFQAACCVIMMTLCPEAMRDFDDAGVDAPHMAAPHHMGGPHGMHDGPRDMDDGPHGIPQECLARIAPAHLALAALAVALVISLSLFFARRRTAMREQFGIEGSVKEDALLYMCCGPCALAQETRTLMHEQVHEGVWYGALPGVQAPVQAAPAGQKMVV